MVTLGGDHHRRVELEKALLFPAMCAFLALKSWSRWSDEIRRACRASMTGRRSNMDSTSSNFPRPNRRKSLGGIRGGRLLDETLDKRQEAARLQANDAAFRFLRKALLWLVAAYWVVWLWMPAGGWRDMLTDSPVIISWLVAFVISLPVVIEMWSEPEEGQRAEAHRSESLSGSRGPDQKGARSYPASLRLAL